MIRFYILITFLFISMLTSWANTNPYWQQRVEYTITVEVDIQNFKMIGHEILVYFNNSPDTLTKAFFHLYYNAFQPNSGMDMRSRSISDPDKRVMSRIHKLKENEIGYHKISDLTQDSKELNFHVQGTIMEVELNEPILPGDFTTFELDFESQIPSQIRRTGRQNKEGIELSMSQWFPKIAEYDRRGWHSHPYIGREFYSPWGDYKVDISINKDYILGATGTLMNPDEIGHGYSKSPATISAKNMLTWKFMAKNVHDFVWAADPDYIHDIIEVENGPTLHFLYQGDTLVENWKKLQTEVVRTFKFANENYGKYPFESYSVIQGGDGGMEYPMATLITGHRTFNSLLGVTVHEIMHSWYQMVLATNESYFAWMDEGFTSYASAVIDDFLKGTPEGKSLVLKGYDYYYNIANSGQEEPLSTHADHFHTNFAYSAGAYGKGAVSVAQLEYLVGKKKQKEGLLAYFDKWKFKHPDLIDFTRVMERVSGLELDWYFDDWVGTTNTIDYGIQDVIINGKTTKVQFERVGEMPMPLDIEIELISGEKQMVYIPIDLMRGEKEFEDDKVLIATDWKWAAPYYSLDLDMPLKKIKCITIDPKRRMADVDRTNNRYPSTPSVIQEGKIK